MPFKRRFKDKYAGSSPENASVVRTLFDLFFKLRFERYLVKIITFEPIMLEKRATTHSAAFFIYLMEKALLIHILTLNVSNF